MLLSPVAADSTLFDSCMFNVLIVVLAGKENLYIRLLLF